MKKIIAVILALTAVFCMASCGNGEDAAARTGRAAACAGREGVRFGQGEGRCEDRVCGRLLHGYSALRARPVFQ